MSDDGESSSAGASRMQRLREGVAQQFAPGVLVRLQYASYLFMGLLVCLLLKGSVGRAMSSVHYLQKGCIYADAAPATPGGSDIFHQASSSLATYASHVCYGNTFVYRVSFALLIFFTIMFLSVSDLSCCIDDKTRAEFQGRFFCWKSALLTLINFLMMWVPNEFFATYAWVCMIVSGIFLVVQVMLLVDFSYVWSEEWSARSDENNKWQWYLAAVAFLCYASGIGLTIHSFFMYVPSSSCNMHGFVLTINVLAAILYTSVAIWVPHGSIVPSGILFSYTSFLVFTALRLDSDASCNLMGPADGSIKTTLVAAVVSAVALAYSVVSCGGTDSAESLALTSNEGGVANAADADEALPSSRRFTTAIGHLPGYCFFYLIMMAGSMYLAMLGTDWQISGNSSYDATTPNNHGSQVAMWVKLATSWLTIAMYLWSLLAPYYCCRDRDFGYDIPTDW